LGTNIASAQCRLLFIAGSWTPAPEGAFDFTVTVPAGKTLTMAIPLVEIVAVRAPGVPASMSLSGIATIASVSTVLGLQVIDANSADNSSSWAVAAVYPGTT
jgi:hypothetical protein